MASVKTPTTQQIDVVYCTDENTNLWAKTCEWNECEESQMGLGNRSLIWTTKGKNATIFKPTLTMDYYGYPMVAFFQITTNSTGTYNSIVIARCWTLNCQSLIVHVVDTMVESTVQNSKLSPQYLFYNPAVVYMKANGSLEYIRCQDPSCTKRVWHNCLDDAVASTPVIVHPVNIESLAITSIITVQIWVICLWFSNRGSKKSDFISKYVTTPYLKTVKMTPKTRSWLRCWMVGAFFGSAFSTFCWVILALRYLLQLTEEFFPLLVPSLLGIFSWLLLRKARAGPQVNPKTFSLIGLWTVTILGIVYSLHRVLHLEFSDCCGVNLRYLKAGTMIGGIIGIVAGFFWVFLINSIRLALKNTKPECSNLLTASHRRWMAPQANRDWVKHVTPQCDKHLSQCLNQGQ